MRQELARMDTIQYQILHVRGHRVLLDAVLAALYEVELRALNQAVKRNIQRFPDDFAFRLNAEEVANLKSQSVISSLPTHGGARRALPLAFTEQGVAMLSGVLASQRAITVNVEIMRAFVRMRQLLSATADLERKLAELESKYDKQFGVVFNAIRQLMHEREAPAKGAGRIGFKLREGCP